MAEVLAVLDTSSVLVLDSVCARLLLSGITRGTISSLSTHPFKPGSGTAHLTKGRPDRQLPALREFLWRILLQD